jgi:putative FmdB family regulatory protein
MRLYDFRCDDCDRVFEELVESLADPVRCPACAGARTTRQLSGFAIGSSEGGAVGRADVGAGGSCYGGGCAGGMCGV